MIPQAFVHATNISVVLPSTMGCGGSKPIDPAPSEIAAKAEADARLEGAKAEAEARLAADAERLATSKYS